MQVKTFLLVVMILTGTLALASAAGAATVTTLKSGDTAVVAGTDLACAIGKPHGKLAVACFRADAKGVVLGSYSVGLSADGRAVLQHVDAKGKFTVVRKLQSIARAAKTISLKPGDGLKVAGSDLACVAVGKAITCFHYTSKGTVPNSYGIILSDTYATVSKYSVTGKPAAVITKLQRG